MARNLMCGEYIGRDGYIHSNRSLPNIKTYNIDGMGFHMDAQFTQDPVTGHVTVECHCPRCERERGGVERNADGTPYKVGESGCGSAQRSD